MKQDYLGNQQVYVGVAGEVFSANFVNYFNSFINEVFGRTLIPTAVSFFRGSIFPSTLQHYVNTSRHKNKTSNILVLDHAIPKTINFLNHGAVFFFDELDNKHRGFFLSSSTLDELADEELFPPVAHPEWVYINLKNKLNEHNIPFIDEAPDVIL